MRRAGVVVATAFGCLALALIVNGLRSAEPRSATTRARLAQQLKDGNFKDAYAGYRELVLKPDDDPAQAPNDFQQALLALQQLGNVVQADDFAEAVAKTHAGHWRVLRAVANAYLQLPHQGVIISGKFERGPHRGAAQQVSTVERDRVRALQLMHQAIPLANKDENHAEAANFYLDYAGALLMGRGSSAPWRLQILTSLDALPDYESGWYSQDTTQGPPVDADGQPVYYHEPKDLAAAKSDGERWRWALAQARELDPAKLNETRWRLATFLYEQFDVHTLQRYGISFAPPEDNKAETSIFALDKLKENETIARLATGVKRLTLPDEFNYIKIFQQIAQEPKTGHGSDALDRLAELFENRRQFPRAAEYWRKAIAEYGPGNSNYRSLRLDQIVGNWGRFEQGQIQPAGKGATFEWRFRNAKLVKFSAQEINVAELVADVKAYLKSSPAQLDWQKLSLDNIGYRLVTGKDGAKYLGKPVANWQLALKPREKHFDDRVTVSTPLQKAGAYLVTAKVDGGNTCYLVVWLADTAIVKKRVAGQMFYFVADAATGKPIEKANLEFFGYRQVQEKGNRFHIETRNFARLTDAAGQTLVPLEKNANEFQWIAVARTDNGRFAFHGFSNFWSGEVGNPTLDQEKVFSITDRPVYRPKQTVQFKFWVAHASYTEPEKSRFADRKYKVEIHNPRGDKVFEHAYTTDAYGGLNGEFPLPENATLGVYSLVLVDHGGGSFRVEEYKKPEYEVKVTAPTTPIKLGDKTTATVEARYYFGAPVTQAKVKYKVLRSSMEDRWFPPAPWDWLYGPGYWWFSYDYAWYPGWQHWGMWRPMPTWFNYGAPPPEVIAEAEAPIGPDGKLVIDIDTALAKELHGDTNHRYSITAEVVDASRRTIVGSGDVLVAREPFKVSAWVDRGFFHTGDAVTAHFAARTLDGQPVQGKGKLRLLKIGYADGKPKEDEVEAWDLATEADGRAEQQFKTAEPGQFRLSYTLTDAAGNTEEAGYVFTVLGEAFASENYRFDDLELIPEKAEYHPGEKVRLQINSNRPNASVLLFLRPIDGMYQPPKLIQLKGKSTVYEFDVTQDDMPNFFIEALTINRAKVFTQVKQIVVPPEKRVVNVKVEPTAEEYKPGAEAAVKITLTDAAGKPVVGSTAVAVYDKAVEYISGGSNVGDIKEFFWKWTRNHSPQQETNLDQAFATLVKPGAMTMNDLGTFGGDENGIFFDRSNSEDTGFLGSDRMSHFYARGRGFGGMGGGFATKAAAAAPMDAEGMAPTSELASAALEKRAAPGAAPMVQPTVRTNFADTALWAAALVTDGDGVATVKLNMPESLTTWKVRAWSMASGTRVGDGSVEVITKKNLLVRLQAPRFFVQKDEVVLSANVHNYLKTKKQAEAVLEVDGKVLELLGEATQKIEVPAGGEARVDWRVKVVAEGDARVQMKALTDEESDAVEMHFPAYVHGMLKTESFAGALRPDKNARQIKFTVPAERRAEQSRLEIRYSPTLAGSLVDALPYLVDYPYGCTEQTLNRFLPTVIAQHTLLSLKVDLAAVKAKRANLNAQEIGDPAKRAEGWKRYDHNPVFDEAEVRKMAQDGLEALSGMQLSDGGWGWFSGFGEHSDPHMTALVVHGLQVAKQNDVAIVPGVLERGVDWLARYQAEQIKRLKNSEKKVDPWKSSADNYDALVYMVLIDSGKKSPEMLDYLYRDRNNLSVYSKAMFGLALEKQGEKEKLAMVLKNIEQFLVQDDDNQTAYLKLPEGNTWWFWYGDEVEAMSYYLRLLARTDPKGETAARIAKYLVNNRKHATYWNSTRDTAVAIESLSEFLKASGENAPKLDVEVWLDGKKLKDVTITPETLFTYDDRVVLTGDKVKDGAHTLELRKKGDGPLYYNAYLTNFTLEEPIKAAGLEVKVERAVYKLHRVDKREKVAGSRGQAVDQKVEKYDREPLENMAELKSGDLVEVELSLESKNDYEYLLLEDFKAAGLEAVDVRSGYNGNALGAYVELRDNRAAFFVRSLPRGKHSVAYRLRAETPGNFSALPSKIEAMYAPELVGNSDEIRLQVAD